MQNIYTDGRTIKGFNIPLTDDDDFGWEVFGLRSELKKDDQIAARVAAVRRAIGLNADAVSSLPFALLTTAGKEYTTSQDWREPGNMFNQVVPNPRRLLRMWDKSLAMRNVGYGFNEKKNGRVLLRYIAPDTIKIDSNAKDGIVGYWRNVGTSKVYYRAEDNIIVPIIRTDWDSEILPSDNTEFESLADAAKILFHSNRFVGDFFARNGIKPHMLLVKGTPRQEDRERLEKTFSRMMAGVYKFFGKVFNAEAMEPVALGSGVDDFKDNGFYRQALEDIAIATGIPLSLLLSNSANLATARIEYQSWYDNKVIPDALFIQDEWNEYFWSNFKMRFEFRPEDAEPNQEDEARKSQSVQTIATSMQKSPETTLAVMTKILGYDMNEHEIDELREAVQKDKDAGMERQSQAFGNQQPQDNQPQDNNAPSVPTDNPANDAPSVMALSAEQINELGTWLDIATRKIKKGQTLELPLTAKYLPDDIASAINAKLEGVEDIAGVKAAFEITSHVTESMEYITNDTSDIKALAEAINLLASNNVQ